MTTSLAYGGVAVNGNGGIFVNGVDKNRNNLTGDVTITDGDLTLTNGDLAVTGNITQTGDYSVTGDINQTGDYTTSGNVVLTSGNLTVTGDTTVTGSRDWSGGNVIYVPAGSGTDDQILIESYITAATAGDTLVLASGDNSSGAGTDTYVISDDIDIAKSINIVGQGEGHTTIACATASKNVFEVLSDNVRIANLSISNTGDTCNGIYVNGTAGTIFSNVVIENVNITSSSAGISRAIYYGDAGGTIRNCILNITSSSATAQGLWMANTSQAEAPTTLKAYNIDVTVSGVTSFGLGNQDAGATQDSFLYLYDCIGTATGGSGDRYGAGAITGDAFLYIYGGTFNGTTADVQDYSSGGVTLYDTTLVNGTTSGTITYGGKVVTKDLYADGIIQHSTEVLTATNAGVNASILTDITICITDTGGGVEACNVALADGVLGQTKTFTFKTEADAGDTVIITPATPVGFATVTFDAVGDSVTMVFDGTSWMITGHQAGTIA